jgi:hypothetical protein
MPGCPVIVCRRYAVSIRGTRMKFDCSVDSHGDLEESVGSDSNNELDLEEMDVILGAVQLPDGLDAVLWEYLRKKLIHLRTVACWRVTENRFL